MVAYHCDNSSFGEQLMTDDKILRNTFVAMSRVDVVMVRGEALRALERVDTATHSRLHTVAVNLVNIQDRKNQPRLDAASVSETQVIDLMVGKQAAALDKGLEFGCLLEPPKQCFRVLRGHPALALQALAKPARTDGQVTREQRYAILHHVHVRHLVPDVDERRHPRHRVGVVQLEGIM